MTTRPRPPLRVDAALRKPITCLLGVVEMLLLYEDSWFTFRLAEARTIPRFHLEGVEAGQRVSVFRIDPETARGCPSWRPLP
jgi:hypothetical protein